MTGEMGIFSRDGMSSDPLGANRAGNYSAAI